MLLLIMVREALAARNAILLFTVIAVASAQAPTGAIAGTVHDPSGAAVPAARVNAVSKLTGVTRTVTTSGQGDYNFPSLLAGEYDMSVEASGFQRMLRQASVETGTTTTADFALRLGDAKDSVTVDAAAPQMQYDSHTVGGVITQGQIEGLPLNGRSFLELAKLEPGVQPPSRSNNNRVFVPVLGAPGGNTGSGGRGTRVTVDGGSIMAVGSFGSQMGFSQEVVQEFQISSANFDLSTGTTDAGAVNVVTRSGGNDLHGSAFYFFRDHTLSAYPALDRDPTNPDPFFQRRQFGFALGGPIRHDRVFFFANWERNEQRGVVDSTLLDPDFAHFSRITTSPFSATSSACALTAESTPRTRCSSATRTMAAGLLGRRRALATPRRILRNGLASRLGSTRACWASPACFAPRWSMISVFRTSSAAPAKPRQKSRTALDVWGLGRLRSTSRRPACLSVTRRLIPTLAAVST